jgi:4-hydroxybenzoate polyprenyltransferase
MRLVKALWRTARVPQSTLNLTVPLLGYLLAGGDPLSSRMALLAAAVLALFCSILAFNNWAGFEQDRCAPAKPFATACGRLGRGGVLAWSLVLLALGLTGTALVAPTLAALATGVFALWGIYSVWGKRHWGYAGLFHGLAGPAHWGLGLLVAGEAHGAAWGLGLALGGGFVAGQWCQEVLDRDADARAGVRSLAVRFGPAAALRMAVFAFILEAAFALSFAAVQLEPIFSAGLFLAVAGALSALRLLSSPRHALTLDAVRARIRFYRWTHLAAGTAMAGWIVLPL